MENTGQERLLPGKTPDRDTLETLKYALLFTALLGLLAHAFAFFNLNPSHDSLFYFYAGNDSLKEHIAFGRPLYFFYHLLTGSRLVLPWSVGALSLFWSGLAVFLTARLFALRGRLELFVLAGLFITNRTITALIGTYIHDLGTYTCSLLLAVLAVTGWRMFCAGRGRRFLAGGAVCAALSLSLYQGFLSTVIVLIMLRSMLDLLQRRRGGEVLVNGLWGIGLVAAGCVGYFLVLRASCLIFDVELAEGSYNTLDMLWNNDRPLLARLAECYIVVVWKFLRGAVSAYSWKLLAADNLLLLGLSVGVSVPLLLRRKLRGLPLALFLLLTAALPLGANLLRLVALETHDLMYFAFWLFYLYPVLAFRELRREGLNLQWTRLLAGALSLCTAFVLYSNIQTANLVYLKKEIQYNATMSLMNNVMHDAEQLEGYVEGVTEVLFVGTPSDVLYASPGTDQVNDITAVFYSSPITYNYESYFRHILQRVTVAHRAYGLEYWPEVQEMPLYPAPGYAAMVRGCAVVRFQ